MPRHTPHVARHGRALLFIIGLLLCAAALPWPLTGTSGAAAPQAAAQRKLAFVYGGGTGSSDIAVINEDGTGQQRLTLNGIDDIQPTWSPDGSQIAFASNRGGAFNIFRMNPNGSGQVPITNSSQSSSLDPDWSPDAQKIVFTSNRAGTGRNEIWVMGADGSNPQRLTENKLLVSTPSQTIYSNDMEPEWSPDGTKIAFASNREGIANFEIYVMNADGGDPVRITNLAQDDTAPAWSADGTRIAFTSRRDNGYPQVYVMNADGTGQSNLTNTLSSSTASSPTWSQDGLSIAYVRINGGAFDNVHTLYRMGADGSNPTLIVDNKPVVSWMPAWQTLGGPKPPDAPAAPPYRVTGRVRNFNTSSPTGVAGVVMELSGTQSAVTQTDADGNYSFEGLAANSTYTVTPKTTSYGYTPTSQTFTTGAPENSVGSGGTITKDFSASPIIVHFDGTSSSASESVTQRGVTVQRFGFLTGTSTVDYAVTGGTATAGSDYTNVSGTLVFAPGQSTRSITLPVIDDPVPEPDETVILTLSNPTGALLGARDSYELTIRNNDVAPNPIDETTFFVTQHYRDFLGREPDAPGLQFWTGEIESCGANAQCREVKRVNVSAAFFLSIEFQQTGYLVERMYKVAYGDITDPSTNSTNLLVPVIRRSEFTADAPLVGAGVVVNEGDWQTTLENNKVAYAQTFVQRQRFTDIYGALSPAQFVDKLNTNAGGVLNASERQGFIDELTADNGAVKRASVLRRVAENAELDRRERNRAYVLMEYFGYLRRNPDDAPESGRNYAGWNFWLLKLNAFNGDAVAAEMVKAFLSSDEYRKRFAQ